MQDYASSQPPIDRITILGVASKPSTVTLNGSDVTFTYDANNHSLLVGPGLENLLTSQLNVHWQ